MTFTTRIQDSPYLPDFAAVADIIACTSIEADRPAGDPITMVQNINMSMVDAAQPLVLNPVNQDKLKEAIKFDANKSDWSMMPWDSVEEILKVLEFGKQKYSAWNWAQGEGFKYSRIFNSLLRHMFAWFRGEDSDPESGLSHLAHAGCNILFLIYFVKHKNKYKNNDDRV